MPPIDRMLLHRFAPLFAVALMACSDAGPSDTEGVPGVYLTGVVRDSDGEPVPGITVTWTVWPAPDSVELGAVSDFEVTWFGRTDRQGRFFAHVGYYSVSVLDSLDVTSGGQDCWGLTPSGIRERALEVSPGTPDTVLSVDLTMNRTAPRGRLVVGPVCAAAVQPPPLEDEHRVTLWIDEVGDSIRGRWDINYTESRGDDYGHFSGVRSGGVVTLDLRHDAPWGTCTGYALEIPVGPGDTLGIGTSSSEGCPHQPVPLRFVEGEALEWAWD
jgi:hypothetical protein